MAFHLGWLDAASVGLLQGVASVFPMSGYGHAVLIGALAGDSAANIDPHTATYLYACLRIAVAIGLFGYFWRDWLHVIRGVVSSAVQRSVSGDEQRRAWVTVLGCAPGIIGVYYLAYWAHDLENHPLLVALLLAGNGVLMLGVWLWWRQSPWAAGLSGSHRAPMSRREEAEAVSSELAYLRWGQVLLVSIMPIAVVVPGVSPTGLALMAGVIRSMTHEQAARFGLVVFTPALLTWGLMDLPTLSSAAYDQVRGRVLLASAIAVVAAYLTAALLVRYFKAATLRPFGLYCLLAGGGATYWFVHMG